MAQKGISFFDSRGQMFKTPEEATLSDLALLLGRIGEGESLAPGIASMMLERRVDIERIFAEHDELKIEQAAARDLALVRAGNVTTLADKRGASPV